VLDGTLDLGASASYAGPVPSAGRKYLDPARRGRRRRLQDVGERRRAERAVAPMNAFIDAPVTTGRVFAHPPSLLPIVTVAAAQGASFTARRRRGRIGGTRHRPGRRPRRRDCDVRVWRIDGAGRCSVDGRLRLEHTSLLMTLYGPDGATLVGTGASHRIYTLATDRRLHGRACATASPAPRRR
jgi:hypothetical protein